MVRQAFDDLPPGMLDRCKGFGLAAPAQMDRQGHVRIAPLLGCKDVDLPGETRETLPIDMPTFLENDANAFAIGESYVRRDSGAGVTLSLVIEIGHIHVADDDGAELEELIGLKRLLERQRAISGRPGASLAEFLADVRDRSPAAISVAEKWARHLAFALVQACRLIDPDRSGVFAEESGRAGRALG